MSGGRLEQIYRDYIVEPGLERTGLLDAIVNHRPSISTVLYPGCFVHVTPSFFFPHIVYVDRSDEAARFFADRHALAAFVAAHQRFRRRPYIKFLHQDFTTPLPEREATFDLLLSLFADGVSRACARYLRVGGLLVTNDHHGDATDAAADPSLRLAAVGIAHRSAVSFDTVSFDAQSGSEHRAALPRRADYYVFERRHLRRSSASSLPAGR